MKRIIALLIAAALCLTGCGKPETPVEESDNKKEDSVKIGMSFDSFVIERWQRDRDVFVSTAKEFGAQVNVQSANGDVDKQKEQIEYFIESGMDVIVIICIDSGSLSEVVADARKAGIKVMCWDDPMTNTDGNWVLNNTDLGKAIGEAAGKFISEHYSADNKAQIAMINYPQTTILLEREEGIKEGLEATASGMYEIVSSQAGLDANQAQTAMETILQRYPDCKIVTGIGAGAMIGTDEALQIATGGNIPEDMGVFTADVTKQQLEHLKDGSYPARVALGFEGSDEDTAKACASMFALILGEKLESQNVFRGLTPVTVENVDAIYAGMK